MNKFGLKESTLVKIKSVFIRYPQIEKVIIYGSRAMGSERVGSDIDLTFIGREITHSLIIKISLDLDDLLLPYTFDISDYKKLDNVDLINHIETKGKIFYQKGN